MNRDTVEKDESPSLAEVTDADSSFEIHSSDDLSNVRAQESVESQEKLRPPVEIDRINKAARTILDHNEAHKTWTDADYPENPTILKKINGPNHYITAAAKHDFLRKFHKYFVQGKECSTEQGDQLRSFVAGIRNKRPATGRGERVKLDVIRKEWRYFLGSVFLGQLCNPFIPRQTGISLQDFNNRIDKAAGKLRDLLFGKPEVEQFLYPAANNVDFRSINLLSKAEIIQDIVNKLADKENSEMTYLRDQLSEYNNYIGGKYPLTPEEDAMHNASREIIDNYLDGKKLKGAGMPDGGKGKKRRFTTYYFLNTPSPRRTNGTIGSSSDSEVVSSGSSQSSQSTISPSDSRPNPFDRASKVNGAGELGANDSSPDSFVASAKGYLELSASPVTVPAKDQMSKSFKSLSGIAHVDDDSLDIVEDARRG